MHYFISRGSVFYRTMITIPLRWLYAITIVFFVSFVCGGLYGVYIIMGAQLDGVLTQIAKVQSIQKKLPIMHNEVDMMERGISALEFSIQQMGGECLSGTIVQKKLGDIIVLIKKSGMHLQTSTIGKVNQVDWYQRGTMHITMQGTQEQFIMFCTHISSLKATVINNYTINVEEKTGIFFVSIHFVLYLCGT